MITLLKKKSTLTEQLPITELFYSLQGEGFHAGKAAYFIRLAGCSVGCHWCDIKESWDKNQHPLIPIEELLTKAQEINCKTIIITGGEPSEHNLIALTQLLKKNKFSIHLETAGTNKLQGKFDWICLSPKKFKSPLTENYKKAHELKIIVYNPSDLLFAQKQAKLVNKNCLLYLQAEWNRNEEIYPLIINFIQQNPSWRISLQSHKYLNIL